MWGNFTNVLWALQNNLLKIHNTRNHIYGENFKLKLCACAQSMALGTRTKFQLEICITSLISAIHKFRENILESSWNTSETTLWVAYRNRSWARKCKSSLTFTSQQNTQSSFNSMYMGNIFCVPFEIPHKISYPYIHAWDALIRHSRHLRNTPRGGLQITYQDKTRQDSKCDFYTMWKI